jgi:hypothetical protein
VKREWVDRQTALVVAVRGVQAGGYDISHVLERDPVRLVAEPDNAFDSNAVKVVSDRGEMLGYLPADYAAVLEASEWTATVSAVLPHPETGASAGLRLALRRRAEVCAS